MTPSPSPSLPSQLLPAPTSSSFQHLLYVCRGKGRKSYNIMFLFRLLWSSKECYFSSSPSFRYFLCSIDPFLFVCLFVCPKAQQLETSREVESTTVCWLKKRHWWTWFDSILAEKQTLCRFWCIVNNVEYSWQSLRIVVGRKRFWTCMTCQLWRTSGPLFSFLKCIISSKFGVWLLDHYQLPS